MYWIATQGCNLDQRYLAYRLKQPRFEPVAFQLVADLPLPPGLQPPQLSSQLLSVTETIVNAKKCNASEKTEMQRRGCLLFSLILEF